MTEKREAGWAFLTLVLMRQSCGKAEDSDTEVRLLSGMADRAVTAAAAGPGWQCKYNRRRYL